MHSSYPSIATRQNKMLKITLKKKKKKRDVNDQLWGPYTFLDGDLGCLGSVGVVGEGPRLIMEKVAR
ncbi:hypothetical protein VNO77_41055 [Canavalia gladiata]|uniref:Uncharacterized protein n=1 Tax=Canavalia gladiata TaxID=3824 RepID=A0AAN9JZJ6_CANGL